VFLSGEGGKKNQPLKKDPHILSVKEKGEDECVTWGTDLLEENVDAQLGRSRGSAGDSKGRLMKSMSQNSFT